MAINLTANQKNIRNLFFNTTQYVIPEFQRPYSWGFDQCNQMYSDLLQAFIDGDDYFLGNIVLACSDENRETPQVIDGQQRLISLWVLMKIMSIFVENIDLENNVLKIKSWKKGVSDRPKIVSCVGDQKDGQHIADLLEKPKEYLDCALLSSLDKKGRIRENKCNNHVEYCALLFYQFLSQSDITIEQREQFTDYLLDKVSLLPIEMGGKSLNEARVKALSIFETINNRGLNLQDADIFKARLYNNAVARNAENDFNDQWNKLTERVSALNINIDEVFRYYYHIVRGQKGIITAEGKLRDFFLNDSNSPLVNMTDYSEFMDSLFRITTILEQVKAYKDEDSTIASWIQVLKAYSNNYPIFAIVAYMFKHADWNSTEFLHYIKSVARCVYYAGSTTTVKFPIYVIIQRMSENLPLDHYTVQHLDFADLSTSSRLLLGYSLIAYYQAGNKFQKNALIEKFVYESELIQARNETKLNGISLDNVYTLGNCVVMGSSLRSLNIAERLRRIAAMDERCTFLHSQNLNHKNYCARQKEIETYLINFFTENENN